ncbi:MAG TPA: hypothetical protein H9829_04340 [Candidatus Tetragenococcus pullicola]|nr:hypothetical protein [Candidatus Tetragenococcus pullicola]
MSDTSRFHEALHLAIGLVKVSCGNAMSLYLTVNNSRHIGLVSPWSENLAVNDNKNKETSSFPLFND